MFITERVRSRIQRMKRGIPFPINGFYSLGTETAVQKAMSRLAKEGVISRVSKGFYVRPKPLKSLPSVSATTSAEQVARAWAKVNGYKLVHQGYEAAYRLGFQTQAPMKSIFWSNGPSRQFKIGNEVVEVRRISEQKLRWPGSPEGALLRSLSVLSPETLEWPELRNAFNRLNLSETESKAVLSKVRNALLNNAWREKLGMFEQQLAA